MKKIVFSLLTACTVLSAAPKAVVFDFGGVMTKEANREAVVQFLKTSFSLSDADFEKVNQEKKKAIRNGQTDAAFWLQYAKENSISLESDWVEKLRAVMKEALGVNPQMYALVEDLKQKEISVGLFSNIDERLAKIVRDFGLYEPFDPCLLSYEIGCEKPDPKSYEALLQQMQLPAEEIVFIDDKLENVEAARQLGFDALLFTSEEQLQKELRKRKLI